MVTNKHGYIVITHTRHFLSMFVLHHETSLKAQLVQGGRPKTPIWFV